MADITLIPMDEDLLAALDAGADAFASRFDGHIDRVLDLARDVVTQTVTAIGISRDTPAWGGYLALDGDVRAVVGSCAFKSAPREGSVEIAYFTFPDFEGRGYGSAMAVALIELAWTSDAISSVTARTLPERNASCRILEKSGMTFDGDVIDPDDGPVWQWRIVRPA